MILLFSFLSVITQQPSFLGLAILPLLWEKLSEWRSSSSSSSFGSPSPRKSPHKKVRLLQEDEYKSSGQEETRKALEGLRKFCTSPTSKRSVKKLKNPERFSEFILGRSHLTENELLEWDQEPCDMTAEDWEEAGEEDSEEDMDELDHYVSTRLG